MTTHKRTSVFKPVASGVAALALVGALAACDPNRPVSNQTIGAGLGAVGGALVGSTIGDGGGNTAAIIIGGVLGAIAGSEIGRVMDENDRLRAEQATQEALEFYPSGDAVSWDNPDSGYSGSTVPQPAFRSDTGETCRRYTQTIEIDGQLERAEGVACRQPNGYWRTVPS